MKKFLKLTFIILLFALLTFSTTSFANEIIYINSIEDYLSFAINNEFYNGYENKIIVLNTDLDFENQPVPIVSGKFKGVFDGQGYSFKNIKIEPSEDFSFELGLFEENLGLIKKVVVESGSITGESLTGAICGRNSGVVEQCANFVNIASKYAIGGIVGWNEGQGVVRNCYNVGNITDLEPGSGGTIGFGGIVGYLYSGTITDCYNVGIIAPERDHAKGNIVGTYYDEDSDRDFIGRCFSLISNSNNISNNESIYCLQLLDFNNEFYSNLSSQNSFIKDDNIYPHINMGINLDLLPPLVNLPSNFEKNPFFENYYKKTIKEIYYKSNIKEPTVYEINTNDTYIDNNTPIINNDIDDLINNSEIISENEDNININDVYPLMNKEDYDKKNNEKLKTENTYSSDIIDFFYNLDEKFYSFFDTLGSLSLGNLALILIIIFSSICIIVYKSSYKNNNSSDGLNDNSDDSNYL